MAIREERPNLCRAIKSHMEHGKGPGEEGARIREPLASPCDLTQVPRRLRDVPLCDSQPLPHAGQGGLSLEVGRGMEYLVRGLDLNGDRMNGVAMIGQWDGKS